MGCENLATKSELDALKAEIQTLKNQLANYAQKSEIPDTSNFITKNEQDVMKSYLEGLINGIESITLDDVSQWLQGAGVPIVGAIAFGQLEPMLQPIKQTAQQALDFAEPAFKELQPMKMWYEAELPKMETSIAKIEPMKMWYEAELPKLESTIDVIDVGFEDMKTETKTLAQELRVTDTKILDVDQKATSALSSATTTAAEVAEASLQILNLVGAVAGLMSLYGIITAVFPRLDVLDYAMTQVQNAIQELFNFRYEIATKVAFLEDVITDIKTQLADITATLTMLLLDVAGLTALMTLVQTITQTLTQLGVDVSTITQTITQIITKIQEITQNLTETKTEVTNLTQNLTETKTEVTTLTKEVTQIKIDTETATQTITEVKTEVTNLTQTLTRAMQECCRQSGDNNRGDSMEFVTISVKQFKECKDNEPQFENITVNCIKGLETQVTELFENIANLAGEKCSNGGGDCVKTTPDWWNVRTPQVPQLCIVFGEEGTTNRWQLTLPHYDKKWGKPKIASYTRGNFQCTLKLTDNSKIIVNAVSKSEGIKMINNLKSFVIPQYVIGVDQPTVTELATNYRQVKVKPMKADYYPEGQKSKLPEFTIDFKESKK